MSYILDALKKSERERARGKIPTLETLSRSDAGAGSIWLGAVLGAGGLLLLAAAVWLLQPSFFQWSSPAPVAEKPAAGQPESRSPEVAAAGPQPETSMRIRDAAPPPSSGPASGADEPRGAAGLEELDPDVRRRIQGLSINVVSYSDAPERRFVMLNQRIVRESETLGDGIVVKRITPEGALLGIGEHEILVGPD